MSHITTITHPGPRGSGGAPSSPDKPPASRRGWRYIGVVLAGSIVLAALLLVLANLASAKPTQRKALPNLKPYLVEDIYPGATGSEPEHLVDFKGKLVFAANHPDFGEELWSSKGKASSTRLVKDIDPGPLVDDGDRFVGARQTVPRQTLDLLRAQDRQVRRGGVEDQGYEE